MKIKGKGRLYASNPPLKEEIQVQKQNKFKILWNKQKMGLAVKENLD